MRIKILVILLSILNIPTYSQEKLVSIEDIFCNVDTLNKIILINQNLTEINSTSPISIIQVLDNEYTFTSPESELQTSGSYEIYNSQNDEYKLYFTQLPIVKLHTSNTIVNEPRVAAHFSLCEMGGNYIASDIGIEIRGGSSKSYPKTSFRLEFLEDTINDKTINVSLLGMRSDDDWNLQAMYNEPLRLRSKVNFALWEKIDNLYYMQEEPSANNSVKQEYIELFINDEYRGIYTLSERIDRKQLQLKKDKNGDIRGELYKGVSWGASTYTSLPNYDNTNELWSGFKYEYPSDTMAWDRLYEYIDFVINDDSLDFYQRYKEQLCLENAVNYFIFLNTLRATDNTGKNLYVAKYNTDEPYFFVPWDLDGTFGTIWNGTQENITNDILTNGLYKRLLLDNENNGFKSCLSKRWKELRQSTITVDSILSMFNSEFNYLNINGVYEREQEVWDECTFIDINNLTYTRSWLEARLNFLDIEWADTSSLTGINNTKASTESIIIFPNPASNYLKFQSSSEVTRISIFNNLGVLQKNIHPKDNTGTIEINKFNSGLYIAVFELDSGKNKVKRFTINKK